MKKILLTLLILVLSSAAASARNSIQDTFLGIRFGSDYDYVVQDLTREEASMLRKALPSTYAGVGEPPLIDIMSGQVGEGLPYITFYPK